MIKILGVKLSCILSLQKQENVEMTTAYICAGPEIRAVGLQSCHIHDCVSACSEGSDAT